MHIILTLIIAVNTSAQSVNIQFTPQEQAWIDANPIVYHGYDPEWKPIGFIDDNGKFSGISSGYLDLIGPRIGIEFKPYSGIKQWSESIQLIKDKKILLLPALAQNEERNTFLDFTDTYSSYPFVIVSRKDGEFLGSLDYLDGKKVATPKDYYITGLLEQEQIDIDFVYKSGTEECLLAVSTGEVEATVVNLAVVSHYLNYYGFENLKIAAPTHYPKMEVKMGVAKGSPEFVSILQNGINTLSQQEKSDIIQNWVSVQYDYGVNMTKVWVIASISASIAILIFGTFFYYNRKMKKEIILRKEAQIALNKSFDEITLQKQIIELKNEEVMASITYAQRLQNAILPTKQQIETVLTNSFVLFLPKDIVSGDFYYLETKNNGNLVFFTAADCTGHGVPGAMVSLVCSNALHQAVIEENLDSPALILDSAKANLEKRFARSGDNIKDGMDVSFCCLNKATKELMWSGGYNPLWVIRSNTLLDQTHKFLEIYPDKNKPNLTQSESFHLIEIRADRQPVGKYEYYKPFTNHSIQLFEGDSVYLSSDGYADQFGGENGKKLKSKTFKNLLIDLQSKSMKEQHSFLNKEFFKWKSDFEQIDDVCVFAVRV